MSLILARTHQFVTRKQCYLSYTLTKSITTAKLKRRFIE